MPAAFSSTRWADRPLPCGSFSPKTGGTSSDEAGPNSLRPIRRTFFHTPAYLKLYWEEFGEQPEHLLLAFAEEDDGRQVGAVAFERIGEVLRFLGGTEVTDYMGPVGVTDSQPQIAAELWRALLSREDWSGADLRGLAQDRSWVALLREAASAEGLRVEETEDQNGVAPFLELAPSWDAYLEALPAKMRHEIKRKAKKLEAEAGQFHIVSATPETLKQFLDRFVELHRMSEGPKGVFMQPGMEIFFRRLGEAFLPSGVFRLSFIDVEVCGRPERSVSRMANVFASTTRRSTETGSSWLLAWCWSAKTSARRSKKAVGPSICSRATTPTSTGSVRDPA